MRRGVIALGIAAPLARYGRARFSNADLAGDFADSGDAPVDLPDFVDVDSPAFAQDLAAIGDLAARFGVERCLTQYYGGASVGELTLGDDGGIHLERVVARKRDIVAVLCPSSFGKRIRSDADLARAPLLLGHGALGLERGLEAGDVHRVAALARHQFG